MQTFTAAIVSAFVDACPDARAAVRYAQQEANAVIEQAERRAKGYDKGAWRDDTRPVDRARYNRIDTRIHESVETAFALARRFA